MGSGNQLPSRYTGRWCGSRRMWPEEALPVSLPLLTPTAYNKNQRQPISDSPTLKICQVPTIPPPHHLRYEVCVGSGVNVQVFPAHLQFLSGCILRYNAMLLWLFCSPKRPVFFGGGGGREEEVLNVLYELTPVFLGTGNLTVAGLLPT